MEPPSTWLAPELLGFKSPRAPGGHQNERGGAIGLRLRAVAQPLQQWHGREQVPQGFAAAGLGRGHEVPALQAERPAPADQLSMLLVGLGFKV